MPSKTAAEMIWHDIWLEMLASTIAKNLGEIAEKLQNYLQNGV
jgi:hypothetical protein